MSLAPYLFIIVTEVLNSMVKEGVAKGVIKGIQLPGEDHQQVMAQFADDTSMSLLDEESSVMAMIATLEEFCAGLGLVLNWEKSSGYWYSKILGGRPPWTNQLNIKWAAAGNIRKLLGSVFGLSLSSGDVDEFLIERIQKKLNF